MNIYPVSFQEVDKPETIEVVYQDDRVISKARNELLAELIKAKGCWQRWWITVDMI